jgi:dienelactone hydrolase
VADCGAAKVNRRAFLFACSAVLSHAQDRLDRENLLLYHDQHGSIQRATNTRHWLLRRAEILKGMQSIMGPLPGADKQCPLDVRIEEEEVIGSYVRRLITYAAEPGSRVPAYLLIPRSALRTSRKAPAVLCLHPTDNEIGHKVVVEPGARVNRQYAAELAERGHVTLAPSYPLLANYQPDLRKLGYVSGTMKAIHDNRRGLDLLDSLAFVAKRGYAAIGHSLGGHNAVYTAVFDDRIRVVVSSCGLDSFVDYKGGDIRGWTSDRYMPRLLAYKDRLPEIPFDFHELIGALAPRACLLSAPLGDDNFQWKSVDRIAASAHEVYKLYGKQEHLSVQHPDCGHDFPSEMRELAYGLIAHHLRA